MKLFSIYLAPLMSTVLAYLDSSMCQHRYKVVILGDSAVGKSSLAFRLVRNTFVKDIESTMGASFFTKILNVDDQIVKLEIWDTAGQERYSSLAPMYYRGAHAALVVYDITNSESYGRAKKWVNQLRKEVSDKVVIVLAGNKSDLEADRQEANTYAEEADLIFVECSAKTGDHSDDLFIKATRKVLKLHPQDQGSRDNLKIAYDRSRFATKPSNSCC